MPRDDRPDPLPDTDTKRAQLHAVVDALAPDVVAALWELLRWTVDPWPWPATAPPAQR